MRVPPAPPPSSAAARAVMTANRRRDTTPERALRAALHARGLRYRVDHPLRVDGGRPVRPDIVLTRARVAVFLDGCFWHSCPQHGTAPRTNGEWWRVKLAVTAERDRRDEGRLTCAGWVVIRVWEHEEPVAAAARVAAVLELRIR